MKKLKAALVGCGRISVCHEDAFRLLSEQVELVYAVDKDAERAKSVADRFHCAYTTEFDQILDTVISKSRSKRRSNVRYKRA